MLELTSVTGALRSEAEVKQNATNTHQPSRWRSPVAHPVQRTK